MKRLVLGVSKVDWTTTFDTTKQVRVLHDYIAAEKGVLSLRLGEVPFLPQS